MANLFGDQLERLTWDELLRECRNKQAVINHLNEIIDGKKPAPEARSVDPLLSALAMFANCDLNEDNCASLGVATRRIRGVAQRALKDYHGSSEPQRHTEQKIDEAARSLASLPVGGSSAASNESQGEKNG